MRMPKIFISHSAKAGPAQIILDALYQRLTAAGYEVLLDQARLQEDTGSPWRDALSTWLELCDGALLLLDERARDESQWVPYEAAILCWRQNQDPNFKLIPICVDPVTPESLRQSRLEPADISALQGLSISFSTTADPVGQGFELSPVFGTVLDVFEPLKRAPSDPTSIERIADLVAGYLSVEDDAIVNAALALGEDLNRWSPNLVRRGALSRLLLASGLPRAITALRSLTLPKENMKSILELLATAWIDCRAVSDLRRHAVGEMQNRVIALNTIEKEVSSWYLLRASGAAPDKPWPCIEMVSGIGEGDAGSYIRMVDDEFCARIRKPADFVKRFIRSKDFADSGPVIVVFLPPLPPNDIVNTLRHEYPHFTFLMLSPENSAAEEMQNTGAELLQPQLTAEKVKVALNGWYAAEIQLNWLG